MEHLWTIPCQMSTIDKDTNALSIVNVLEDIQFVAPYEPDETIALPMSMHVVTLWSRGKHEETDMRRARLRILAPNGELLSTTEYEVNLVAHKRFRFVTRFVGIPFNGSGVYRLVVDRDTDDGRWRKVAEVELSISRQSLTEE